MRSPLPEFAQLTDVGRVREHNEDSVLAMRLPDEVALRLDATTLLLVADGVGGHHGGELASGEATATVRARFEDVNWVEGHADTALEDAIAEANERVFALGRDVAQGRPGTTMTLALLGPRTYRIGHVGDSRAYLIGRDGVVQLTDDDTHVAEAVRRGRMTPSEARTHPYRNQISQCVGTSERVSPAVLRGAWERGEALLLCSDGLSEYVDERELLVALRETPTLFSFCDRLVWMANERGGHDNISVVVARNGETPVARKPATPPLGIPAAPRSSDRGRLWWPLMMVASMGLAFAGGVLVGRLGRPQTVVAPAPAPSPRSISFPPPSRETPARKPSVRAWIDEDGRFVRLQTQGLRLVVAAGSTDLVEADGGGATVRFKNWKATRPSLDHGATLELTLSGRKLATLGPGKGQTLPIPSDGLLRMDYVFASGDRRLPLASLEAKRENPR